MVNNPCTPIPYQTSLFNDEYVMDLTQRLKGSSYRIKDYNRITVLERDRSFYISEENGCHRLFQGEGSNYGVEYDLGGVTATESYNGFHVEAKTFVPVEGKREFWKLTVTNTGDKSSVFNLFCHFPIFHTGPMQGSCNWNEEENYIYKYAFPYHVFFEEMEKVREDYPYTYVISDCKITSFDGCGHAFTGYDNPFIMPVAVKKGMCSNCPGIGRDLKATAHYRLEVAPGESSSVTMVVGCAIKEEEIKALAAKVPSFEEEYVKVERLWEKRCGEYHIETPYTEINHLFNKWFKKEATFLTRLNRNSNRCPIRNQLQDAMGYSFVEPMEAFEYAMKVLRRQHFNGYSKQWIMADGAPEAGLCKLEHSDGPIWLILCITEIINNIGDKELFYHEEAYADRDVKESVFEHLRKAALYMSTQVGVHGLCLFLDGDWTDPINGAGRGRKGESVWNSEALVYAIRQLTAIFPDEELTAIADKLAENINKYCWDGKWYIAGFNDEGIAFGTSKDKEARLFLNTQTWAFIAGIVPEERKAVLRESIETLKTPFGYLLLDPALTSWDPNWGRVSVKQAGTNENGSVYCHASMFKALGDCMQGEKTKAFETLLSTLPVNAQNPPEKNLQLPIFVPNCYIGLKGANFGKSSARGNTGTNAWMIWVMLKHILGVKTSVEGISFDNSIPSCLEGTKITRKFRGEIYEF